MKAKTFTFTLNTTYYLPLPRQKFLRGPVKPRTYRFVKATPKGFDFLDEHTGKLIYTRGRLYDRRYRNKTLPRDLREVQVSISPWNAPDRFNFFNKLRPAELVQEKQA